MSTPLNPAQRRAVNHVEGPLLVLAGPGSGKTRVVTHRIARLMKHGVPPSAILAVTFTNKAAREMRERVRALVGKRGAPGLTIATFHSACVRILRQEIEPLGYAKTFSIYDERDQAALMRVVLREVMGAGATRSAGTMLAAVGARKTREQGSIDDVTAPVAAATADAGATEAEDADAAFREAAATRYEAELKARNAIDFDDILLLTRRLLREQPEVLARLQKRWHFFLVDEYQDTNRAQDDILQMVGERSKNVCVVGDDDQSIYGWRGAEVKHIVGFGRRWPDAEVVKLEQNYRSTARIVAAASSLIARNSDRHAKDLFSERGDGDAVRVLELDDEEREAQVIATEIARTLERPGVERYAAAGRFAVLFRTNEQMRPLEQALRQANVPYKLLGGKSFFDRKEVVDVLAYLRAAHNNEDEEAFLRIVNTPSRGFGAKAIAVLTEHARARNAGLLSAFREVAEGTGPTELKGRSEAAKELVAALDRVTVAAARRSETMVSELLDAVRYQDEIDRSYQDDQVRAARLTLARQMNDAWISFLNDTKTPTLAEFLDSLSLRDRDDDGDGGGGATLATVHASKGLEWDEVFVAGMEEGIFPHSRSVDDARELGEERRVLYVALTRARDRLTLTRCLKRSKRGRETETTPSRFLAELADVVERETADRTEKAKTNHLERMRALFSE